MNIIQSGIVRAVLKSNATTKWTIGQLAGFVACETGLSVDEVKTDWVRSNLDILLSNHILVLDTDGETSDSAVFEMFFVERYFEQIMEFICEDPLHTDQ